MNNQWKAFLESRSARIDDEGRVRFPNAPVEAACALSDLSDLGLIAVTGPEAAQFLQGQLTNDVVGLQAGHSQLGSHCSPKGRMLACFRVIKLEDGIYLQLPRSKVEATVQRLRMYLLRAKARIEDASDRVAAIGIAGDCAPGLLAARFARLPDQDNEVTCQAGPPTGSAAAAQPATGSADPDADASIAGGDLILARIPGPVPRFEILGPPAALESVWDDLAATATLVDADYWALLDIRAGIPSVYPETSDAFVPQMANLELVDGVSFTKGCYTGQEVVARMRYLGKIKRRMYRAEVRSPEPPAPGSALHCPTSGSAQGTGRVVDARPNDRGGFELLVVVEIAAAEQGEVRLGGPEGPLLSFAPPPYGFPAEE